VSKSRFKAVEIDLLEELNVFCSVSSFTWHKQRLQLMTQTSFSRRRGDEYVLDGKKWWTTGACDPRCAVAVFMGKSDTGAATYRQQSMILVPMSTPGALPLLHRVSWHLTPRASRKLPVGHLLWTGYCRTHSQAVFWQ